MLQFELKELVFLRNIIAAIINHYADIFYVRDLCVSSSIKTIELRECEYISFHLSCRLLDEGFYDDRIDETSGMKDLIKMFADIARYINNNSQTTTHVN